jgi:cytoskeletal protein CcmA (bactofilin family)
MRFMSGKAEDDVVSHLGEGAEITGEVSFAKGMLVTGTIKGKVRSDALLKIGPGGKVDAEVNVRKISIKGEFRGVIHASDRVEIHKEGRVVGDIYSPCLIIEAGAIFEGRCNMSDNKKAPEKTETKAAKTPESASGKLL